MNTARDIHHQAMTTLNEARMAKMADDQERYLSLARQAFELEKDSALQVLDPSLEPTRSILLKSAAVIAMELGETREAEKLLSLALAGDPPDYLAEEIREYLDRVNFERHLSLKGITLTNDDIQMALDGNGVYPGMAPKDDVFDRITLMESILIRTSERKMGKPFRKSGRPLESLRSFFTLYMSVPREASFAVTLKIGEPTRQLDLTEEVDSSVIIKEFLDDIEAYNNGNSDTLKQLIPDKDYLENFLSIADQLSPDGTDINLVGFTCLTDGNERRAKLTCPKKSVMSSKREKIAPSEEDTIFKGQLKRADSLSSAEYVTLVTDENEKVKIKVPESIMSDIIPIYYKHWIEITVTRKNSTYLYKDIRKIKSDS